LFDFLGFALVPVVDFAIFIAPLHNSYDFGQFRNYTVRYSGIQDGFVTICKNGNLQAGLFVLVYA